MTKSSPSTRPSTVTPLARSCRVHSRRRVSLTPTYLVLGRHLPILVLTTLLYYPSQHVLASGDVRLLRYFDLALNRVRSGDQYVLDQVLTIAILTMAILTTLAILTMAIG